MLYNIPNISNKDEILARIQFIYKSSGLNQIKLAEILDISQAAVSKYLKERIPPAEILLKIAFIGNTTIEWLLTGKTEIKPPVNAISDKKEIYKSGREIDLYTKIEKLEPPVKAALETLIDKLISF